jgi:alkylation response protein AidB-like acyl-CoA dehydrogenase
MAALYAAPREDIRFVVQRMIGAGRLAALPGHEEVSADLLDGVVDALARLADEAFAPLDAAGDLEGCRFENGTVTTPAGFGAAYRTYAEGGWNGLDVEAAWGGQALPHMLMSVMHEMLSGANMALAIVPGLTQGAIRALLLHGSEAVKAAWLPRLVSGEWTGTMCLTEPQCGTDLGLVRTRAEPAADGAYAVTGQKIFISAGDHDLAANIVHLVLARLPGAPAGTRGLSLFVVPKIAPDGGRNAVRTVGIEHKMGIHGSPTCALAFEGAVGWLVGEPHRGMAAMFTMMNAARLSVAMQGVGLAEAAYQRAAAYARDRRQGRAPRGAAEPEAPADPIVVHPDVRRHLMGMRAFLGAARLLTYETGLDIDRAERDPDPAARAAAADRVALMTPILKAWCTDEAVACANAAMQIFGGHGYIRDNGVERLARDARITQIYEGANGIQALDLVGRKMGQDTGRLLRRFFHPLEAFLRDAGADPAARDLAAPLGKAFERLQRASLWIAGRALADPTEGAAAASDYLRLFALTAAGWAWARIALHCAPTAATAPADADRIATARYFMAKVLPETGALLSAITAGAAPVMAIAGERI